MSVLIKEMEIPHDCDFCKVSDILDCTLWKPMDIGERHPECPLVEVPEPHGRLIGKDGNLMSDLVSRQAAIEAVRKCTVKEVTPAYMLIDKAEVMTELMLLPPAQPERKKGKWLGEELGRCSVCGHYGCASDIWDGCKGMYCPNCGSDLKGEEDGTT